MTTAVTEQLMVANDIVRVPDIVALEVICQLPEVRIRLACRWPMQGLHFPGRKDDSKKLLVIQELARIVLMVLRVRARMRGYSTSIRLQKVKVSEQTESDRSESNQIEANQTRANQTRVE